MIGLVDDSVEDLAGRPIGMPSDGLPCSWGRRNVRQACLSRKTLFGLAVGPEGSTVYTGFFQARAGGYDGFVVRPGAS